MFRRKSGRVLRRLALMVPSAVVRARYASLKMPIALSPVSTTGLSTLTRSRRVFLGRSHTAGSVAASMPLTWCIKAQRRVSWRRSTKPKSLTGKLTAAFTVRPPRHRCGVAQVRASANSAPAFSGVGGSKALWAWPTRHSRTPSRVVSIASAFEA